MKLSKRINWILGVTVISALLLSQTSFASAYTSSYDQEEKTYCYMSMGGAEPASDTSIRIYWGDFTTAGQGYRIMWRIPNSDNWQSVEISDPQPNSYLKAKSYVIKGLKSNQEYDIRVAAIIKDENGKTYAAPMGISGHTYLQTPICSNAHTSGKNYIQTMWFVHERNARLKIYRSNAKNGKYKLVKTTDGRENDRAIFQKDHNGMIIFRDTNVVPGRTYYYKGVSQLTLDDGRVLTKESQPDRLKTEGSDAIDAKFTTTLLNKQSRAGKVLTWKLTSVKGNQDLTLLADNMFVEYMKWTKDKFYHKQPEKVEFSLDGKKYFELINTASLKPGKSIYLRITLPDQIWISKDTIGILSMNTKYSGKAGAAASFQNRRLVLHTDDWSEFLDPAKGHFDTLDWRATYAAWLYHGHDMDLTGSVDAERNVVLNWQLCSYAQKFSIQYGTTEEEAANSKAVEVSKGQFAYLIKGLKAGQSYVFIVTETYQDNDGQMKAHKDTITIKIPA